MHVLLTGGTGLIGRSLCGSLLADDCRVSVLSRRPDRVAALCGAEVRGVGALSELDGDTPDAVVNLAGAPIADGRWTAERKAALWASRVTLTEQLVAWLGELPRKPSVLISGSAVGWYGDTGDATVDETHPARSSYTHTLCDAWETAAQRAAAHGIRVCQVRTGLVLAPGGGFLQKMLPPFRLGLGGPIGPGRQYMPWIHLRDEVGVIRHLLANQQCRGPFNATAPQPVTNREFAKTLGAALNRPALLPLPSLALKLGLGEMAQLLLGGQNAIPRKALESGYTFRFTELETALRDVLDSTH
ncbi:TIGR01777 family oxidoreductase [Halopseudomonas nanhaiensis]|uniref:TIGR01777 family oxidoreductase n=1 Tax=Halopseudomonas nanhaiensis TaxID=2830842 RepID=UPI001CBA6F16|nr:TIGR01777 family oxidoreductase [Halopseudomonas nanhaiensis]UAW97912.1 TIGR01777 family oxidoreductase [Halopseudomonas nanhaiensis]